MTRPEEQQLELDFDQKTAGFASAEVERPTGAQILQFASRSAQSQGREPSKESEATLFQRLVRRVQYF